jgi:carbonic anhydrase
VDGWLVLKSGSDARVPESTLFNAAPGEIFVHRNVANTYSQQDDSINSVIMLAIQNLKIKHIMVVGHTACVGCQSALSASMFPEGPSTTPLQRFLKPLITLARRLKDELGHPPSLDLLVEVSAPRQQS